MTQSLDYSKCIFMSMQLFTLFVGKIATGFAFVASMPEPPGLFLF